MTAAAILDSPAACAARRADGTWPRQAAAVGVALGVHAAVLALLLLGWQDEPPPAPQVRTLTTRLVALAPPAPPVPAPVQAEPAPVEPPPEPSRPVAPPKPVEAPKPDPRLERQKLEQAALARKRVEGQKREQQRIERQREQERRRREAEALAQRQERQRQAEAAERARAEAAAVASRQYLPIAKQAPDYPERALDKGIEGDCTVRYRVNPQGRVEDPQIVGDCHPLFVRPSLAAARTFRYQPRIVNGQAMVVHGVKNTFHYRIQE
ncbi:energy transducer TonB [Azotobacter armeniacus]